MYVFFCVYDTYRGILLDRHNVFQIQDFLFYLGLGTTWTQEMVWCIMNNLDYKLAKETILEKRVPFFEYVL